MAVPAFTEATPGSVLDELDQQTATQWAWHEERAAALWADATARALRWLAGDREYAQDPQRSAQARWMDRIMWGRLHPAYDPRPVDHGSMRHVGVIVASLVRDLRRNRGLSS
jgi:hypothetical protein